MTDRSECLQAEDTHRRKVSRGCACGATLPRFHLGSQCDSCVAAGAAFDVGPLQAWRCASDPCGALTLEPRKAERPASCGRCGSADFCGEADTVPVWGPPAPALAPTANVAPPASRAPVNVRDVEAGGELVEAAHRAPSSCGDHPCEHAACNVSETVYAVITAGASPSSRTSTAT